MNLRPYQADAVKAVREQWKEVDSTLIVMPTGCGKTITFAHLIRSVFPARVLVIAHREELIFQAADKIHKVTGFRCAVEMADFHADMEDLLHPPQVVVSTIQTQCAGGDGKGRMSKFDPSIFQYLIIDEGHHATADSYRRMIDYYRSNPRLKILGVTATPDRADEEALGQVFQTVAKDYEILEAIQDGWLVPVQQKFVTIEGLDFSRCRTTAGDLNGKDLAEIMEYEQNLQGVCSATIDTIGTRRAIVFSSSVDHAERLCEIFNRHRPNMATWVCGKTEEGLRRRRLADFASGQTQIVCNCGVLTEGYDDPGSSVIVMARPTKSRCLYAQMAGRGMRPAFDIASELNDYDTSEDRRIVINQSSKPECLILDFVGNSGRHKLVTTADILGGNVSDEAIEAAVKKAKEAGGPVDMTKILEEQEAALQREAARRARLVAKANYAATMVDPFGVFNITPKKERGWDRGKKLSEKQHALLLKQGINPDNLGYVKSRQILDEIFRRWDQGLCSFKQAKLLKKNGLDINLTRDEASKAIDSIAEKQGWAKKDPKDVASGPGPRPVATPELDPVPF